ncbi:hypothetical protein QQY66_11370 [Streptomyces sp. DG2A-72]|uniref:hypothetical protein n=1 Tax=Streptomyces sp. DG2A-72 TaxID=3051386 RepID=UPI00265BC447|nr:hypothetical protein [Streptomyces sp. DG2A-72]MDO0932258.1 hypothetical protein [Streptomyces sp. DG2A-72]
MALPLCSLVDGRVPENVCVNACLTLRNAYDQLGVRAELLPVDLAIATGTEAGRATATLPRRRIGYVNPAWCSPRQW